MAWRRTVTYTLLLHRLHAIVRREIRYALKRLLLGCDAATQKARKVGGMVVQRCGFARLLDYFDESRRRSEPFSPFVWRCPSQMRRAVHAFWIILPDKLSPFQCLSAPKKVARIDFDDIRGLLGGGGAILRYSAGCAGVLPQPMGNSHA